MQQFYETCIFHYGRYQNDYYHKVKAVPILRMLYQEGKFDKNDAENLSVTALRQAFTILLYSFLIVVVVAIGEITKAWLEN